MAPPKAAALIWRDYADPLNSLLGVWWPDKAEIRVWTGWVELSFTSAENRLSILENLSGIPSGSNLVADVATAKTLSTALSRALSSYRPGDVLASWSTSVTLGKGAVPLTVGGNYSIVTGADGDVLQITGGATYGVGPSKCDEIVASEVYDYTVPIQRVVDGSNAALLVRLAVFDPADTYLGPLTILNRSPTVADGFKREVIRVAANTVLAAYPTAVRAKPYLSAGSTNGTMRISMIRRRTVEGAVPDPDYNINNVTGWSSAGTSMAEDQFVAIHGQSLANGTNYSTTDTLLATTALYPAYALSLAPANNQARIPRLATTPPDTYFPLVENAALNAGETELSGMASHFLRQAELEAGPAKAIATISGGAVVSTTITLAARGYGSVPFVTVDNTGTGGTGAAFTAVIDTVENGGTLLSLVITNAGSGYTTAPALIIGGNNSGNLIPRLVCVSAGKVGAKYLQIKMGESRLAWIMAAAKVAKKLSNAHGRSLVAYDWGYNQGQAELITGFPQTAERLYGNMAQYHRDYTAMIQLVLGQTRVPLLIVEPVATVHPDYDQWSQPYPSALVMMRRHPHIILTGGTYHHQHSDPSHLSNAGYNHDGQQWGRARAAALFGAGWRDVHPAEGGAWRTGSNTFAVRFELPDPETPLAPRLGLMFDLSDSVVKLAGIQGYGGFAARSLRDGRAIPITNISVGPDGRTLTFTHGTASVVVPSSDVVPASNLFNVPDTIGWETGVKVRLTSSGTLPSGLSAGTDYWIVRSAGNQIRFANSLANALAGVVVSTSNAGSGNHTVTTDGTLTDGPIQLVYATRRNVGNTNDDGPILGGRGCLRNNRAQVNLYDGYLSHDWCTPFDIVVA